MRDRIHHDRATDHSRKYQERDGQHQTLQSLQSRACRTIKVRVTRHQLHLDPKHHLITALWADDRKVVLEWHLAERIAAAGALVCTLATSIFNDRPERPHDSILAGASALELGVDEWVEVTTVEHIGGVALDIGAMVFHAVVVEDIAADLRPPAAVLDLAA